MGKRVWDLSAISVWRNEEICYMSEELQQKLRTQVGIFETVVQGTVPSVSLKDRIPLYRRFFYSEIHLFLFLVSKRHMSHGNHDKFCSLVMMSNHHCSLASQRWISVTMPAGFGQLSGISILPG